MSFFVTNGIGASAGEVETRTNLLDRGFSSLQKTSSYHSSTVLVWLVWYLRRDSCKREEDRVGDLLLIEGRHLFLHLDLV